MVRAIALAAVAWVLNSCGGGVNNGTSSSDTGSGTTTGSGSSASPSAIAPTITTQPQSQSVAAGATATFTVAATGTAPLAYQWTRGGTAIAGATAASYTTPATVAMDDGASFAVVVTNSGGSVTSASALLSVTVAPTAPLITTQPQSQTVALGGTATFAVVATGTSPLTYQWSKNGTAIAGATAASYTTPATVTTDNAANFTVVVSNTAGSVTSAAATLSVTVPVTPPSTTAPAITTQPQNQSVSVGATATFSVVATGTAPLSYQWSRGATAIAGATAASYTTPATTTTDNGATFTVVVTNAAGSVTSTPATLSVAVTSVDVLTYHNDNGRTGQNLAETSLTTATVTSGTFGLLRTLAVDGKVDAQPLVVSGYPIGGASHNVVYIATEHDSVYAYDADSGSLLWTVSLLGAGESTSDNRNCNQVSPEIGVTATPAIDRTAGIIYVVAMSKDSGGNYHQRLHALSLASGAETANSPVDISAAVTATGASNTVNGQLVFDPAQYKERSALLLANGTLYLSWASHCDITPYTGWIMAYSQANLAQTAVFNDELSATGSGGDGAFWNANSGPSADSAGSIYAMVGNGVFDTALTAGGFPSGGDYGNAILKLSPATSGLSVLDYFTMYNTVAESQVDDDLGSGGLMLLPDLADAAATLRHLAVGAGKDHNIYLVDRDNLGKFVPGASDNSHAYQALMGAFPASSPGGSCNSVAGEFGAPVYFNGVVYFAAAGDAIRAYPLSAARLPTTASSVTSHAFCYPGAAIAVSANGTANGIVWASENTGVLHAYDATNLASELYNSGQAGTRDQYGSGSKFTPPTIANGKVFVATQGTVVAVFGLL